MIATTNGAFTNTYTHTECVCNTGWVVKKHGFSTEGCQFDYDSRQVMTEMPFNKAPSLYPCQARVLTAAL